MKNSTMKYFGIAAAALFLAGCDEIKFNGGLNVLEQLTFRSKGKTVVVQPGNYDAKAVLGASGDKKKIKLEIKNADPATEVKLEFDKNIQVGETFNITAAQLGQNFDLAGTMATKVEKSPEYSTYEACTYQYPQTVCRSAKSADEAVSSKVLAAGASEFATVAAPEASNPELVEGRYGPYPGYVAPPHTPVCHTVWVTRPGQRYVRYYVETTDRDIDAAFVQNGRTLANYKGHSRQNETIYTYQSDCR